MNPGNVPDSYQIFYGADRAFLHLVLELEPSTASLQWAQQIIQAHPGLPTIVSLHEYLKCNGDRSGNDFRGGSTGLQIWQNLVSTNSQIFMVLCGHTYDLNNGVGQARRMSTNSAGKVVFELLSDYQGAGDTGSGFMRFMDGFDSALQCINVTTYSPLLDTQVTDSSSQFTLSFDWNDRCKDALREVDTWLKAGHHWVVDADIKGYFDNISHELMMCKVEQYIVPV